MKPRRRPFAGTLDSLMDTTTNVVGILVIVLVITQLGVSSAVNRIRANLPEVTAEQLEKERAQAAELREMTARIAEGATAIESQIAIDESLVASGQTVIEKLRAEIEAAQKGVAEAEQEKKQLDEQLLKSKALATELAKARAELARLKQQLAAVPKVNIVPPKEIHLPNPREAPKGAAPLVILCRENRALAVPEEGLRNLAEARIGQLRLQADATGAVDGQKLVDYFERVDVGNRQFRLRFRLHNFVPYLVFEPRPMAGETIEALQKPGASLGVELHRADGRKQFARFLVWSDSFEVYVEARALADGAKLPAGWEPMLPTQVHQISLASSVKVRKPPPPPPLPPPPPAKDAPPKPDVPIPPPKPPLPKDDID